MRTLAALVCVVFLLPNTARAQQRGKTYTQARLPDQSELDRLNLKVGFSTSFAVEGRKDGIATLQLFDNLLIAQLRSGYVSVLDAETGAQRWSVRPGGSFPTVIPDVAVDDRYVIVSRDVRLYAYNRQSGHLEWTFELSTIPSSAAVTDGERLYIIIGGNRLVAYDLPVRPEQVLVVREGLVTTAKQQPAAGLEDKDRYAKAAGRGMLDSTPRTELRSVASVSGSTQTSPSIGVVESVLPPYRLNSNTRQTSASISVLPSVNPPYRLNSDVQGTPTITMAPTLTRLDELSLKNVPATALSKRWMLLLDVRVSNAAVVTSGPVVVASTERIVTGSPKLKAQQAFSVETTGNISAPMGQYGDMIFVPTIDANFYAIDALRGRVLWRYTTDNAVASKPAVVGADVFLTTIQDQLYRLSRDTGESAWYGARASDRFVPQMRQFLAANAQFAYALDTSGKLTALDRVRGTRLGSVDTREYTIGLSNNQSDRIYMASNDGTLVCLRDRGLNKPMRHEQKPASVGSDAAGFALPAPGPDKPKVPVPSSLPADKPKTPAPKGKVNDKGEMPKNGEN